MRKGGFYATASLSSSSRAVFLKNKSCTPPLLFHEYLRVCPRVQSFSLPPQRTRRFEAVDVAYYVAALNVFLVLYQRYADV